MSRESKAYSFRCMMLRIENRKKMSIIKVRGFRVIRHLKANAQAHPKMHGILLVHIAPLASKPAPSHERACTGTHALFTLFCEKVKDWSMGEHVFL